MQTPWLVAALALCACSSNHHTDRDGGASNDAQRLPTPVRRDPRATLAQRDAGSDSGAEPIDDAPLPSVSDASAVADHDGARDASALDAAAADAAAVLDGGWPADRDYSACDPDWHSSYCPACPPNIPHCHAAACTFEAPSTCRCTAYDGSLTGTCTTSNDELCERTTYTEACF